MLKFFTFSFITILSFQLKAQFTEQWHKTFNGQGDYSDRYTCITNDASGNIYVAGSTSNPNENLDFLVAKFNSNGSLAWRKTFAGTGSAPDEANAIAFSNGKVYVTGYLNTLGFGNDFCTISLSEAGDSLWAALYNDPAYNQYEQANDIAVDASGAVTVCGESDRDPSSLNNDDFLTIHYSPTGTQLWVQRFNDLGNTVDRALALALNSAGEIFVAGRSNNGADDDYAVIKYNTSGVQQWSQFMDNGGTDRATDIDIDDAGNIYVTGRSSNGADDDFRTVKYSTTGLEIFNVAFDNVEDDRADYIDVAGDGTFAITGRSDANATTLLNYDYRTVKYNSSGIQQWTMTYEGTGTNDDIVQDISLQTDGSVIVTGYSDANNSATIIQNDLVTIKYASNGAASWTKVYAGAGGHDDLGNACSVDANGNVWVAAQTEDNNAQRNALLLKYNTGGTELSADQFNGNGDNGDNVRDMLIDANHNVYVAGYSVGKDADRNMFVCKLNSSGDTLWTRQINGTLFGSDEEANALAMDNAGNVYISGYTKNSGTSSDITIAKYNSTGLIQWSVNYNGLVNESDRSYDMEVDGTGNVFITGKTDINISPIITNDQIFTAKYQSNGLLAWSAIYDGGTGLDRGKFIRVAASGNIYVVGRRNNGTNEDYIVIKYNSLGVQQWVKTLDAFGGNDDPRDVAIDSNENIYITGTSESSLNSLVTDIFTAAYNSAGTLIYSTNYNGSGNGSDVGEGIQVDGSGNVYVTGYMDTDASAAISDDCITLKYTPTGTQQWMHVFNGANNLDDLGDDLALDASGNVLVTCHSNSGSLSDIQYDLVTFALDPTNGNPLQQTTYSVSDSINVANVIRIKDGEIYLGGSTWTNSTQRDILVVKYALVVGIDEIPTENIQVYPNPMENELNVILNNYDGPVDYRLYDMSGNIIMQGILRNQNNKIDLVQIASGVYSLTLGNDELTNSKMIIKK